MTDARNWQLIYLSFFLILGIFFRDWTIHPLSVGVILFSCLLTQFFWQWKSQKIQIIGLFLEKWDNNTFVSILNYYSWKSATITALGLSLLLRSNHLIILALAGVVSISSKFIFCTENKHYFNPANFGIIMALSCTSSSWVSPGQWGSEGWYLALFTSLGAMILQKVGRWDTSAVFLGVYGGLVTIRNLWLGWEWDVLQHQLMSGSLLLFAFFMITDPRSIPNSSISRIYWSSGIAVLAFILQYFFYLKTALFWSLFVFSPLTYGLDKLWKDHVFTWTGNTVKTVNTVMS